MGHARLGNHPASVCGRGGGSARAPLPCDSLSPLPITRSSAEIDGPPPARSLRPRLEPQLASPEGDRPSEGSGIPGNRRLAAKGTRLCPAFLASWGEMVGFAASRAMWVAPGLWPH